MHDRRREIRDRIEKRRKQSGERAWTGIDHSEDEATMYSTYEPEQNHPLFKKEYFFFKLLAAICLFLIVAVIFRYPSQQLDVARNYVTKSMNQDFQFAAVSSWYELTFGKPIAFLPQKEEAIETVDEPYALPASAKITQTFRNEW